MHLYTPAYTQIHKYTYIYLHTYKYIRTHTHTHLYIYIYIYIYHILTIISAPTPGLYIYASNQAENDPHCGAKQVLKFLVSLNPIYYHIGVKYILAASNSRCQPRTITSSLPAPFDY